MYDKIPRIYMAKPETYQRLDDEARKVRQVRINPAVLLEDNLATSIVDPAIIAGMSGENFKLFDPERFAPPEIIRVANITDKGYRYFIRDGHHRTRLAADYLAFREEHKDNPQIKLDFDFEFVANDVTDSLIARKYPGQAHTTMAQYLLEVVQPTDAHRGLAAQRIATHLITGWPGLVGDEVAKKCSMLSALNFLADPKMQDKKAAVVKKHLATIREEGRMPLMVDETPEERDALEKGLVQMADVMLQLRLTHEEVSTAALSFIASEEMAIGGKDASQNEIRGLFSHPRLNDLLTQIPPQLRAQKRLQLENALFTAFGRFKDKSQVEEVKAVHESLMNTYLGFEQVMKIITAEKPSQQYQKTKCGINEERLHDHLNLERQSDEVNNLVKNLSDTVILDNEQLSTIAYGILEARKGIKNADALLINPDGLSRDKKQEIEAKRQAVLDATTLQAVSRAVNALKKTVEIENKRLADESNHASARESINQVFNRELIGPAGELVKKEVIDKISMLVDLSDRESVDRIVAQLHHLGEELFGAWINNDLTFDEAQEARRKLSDNEARWSTLDVSDEGVRLKGGEIVSGQALLKIKDATVRNAVLKGTKTFEQALDEQARYPQYHDQGRHTGRVQSDALSAEDTKSPEAELQEKITEVRKTITKFVLNNKNPTTQIRINGLRLRDDLNKLLGLERKPEAVYKGPSIKEPEKAQEKQTTNNGSISELLESLQALDPATLSPEDRNTLLQIEQQVYEIRTASEAQTKQDRIEFTFARTGEDSRFGNENPVDPHSSSLDWENVTYSEDEGKLDWFQSKETFDPVKTTKMIEQAARNVIPEEVIPQEKWEEIINGITYLDKDREEFHGYDAVMRALVQDGDKDKNLRRIVMDMGLQKGNESDEFKFLSTLFIWHAVLFTPTLQANGLDHYSDSMYEQMEGFVNFQRKHRYFGPLLYGDLKKCADLINLLNPKNQFNEAQAKRLLRDQESVKTLFESKVLRTISEI